MENKQAERIELKLRFQVQQSLTKNFKLLGQWCISSQLKLDSIICFKEDA